MLHQIFRPRILLKPHKQSGYHNKGKSGLIPLDSGRIRQIPKKWCIFGNRFDNRLNPFWVVSPRSNHIFFGPNHTDLKREATPMSRKSKGGTEKTLPEIVVRREGFDKFFDPPLATSSFHDLVNRGKIIPMKGMRGFYLLNESLRRMGLPEVSEKPSAVGRRSLEDIARLAFTLIDPRLFPAPSWLLAEEGISVVDAEHARRLANEHREKVAAQDHVELKLAYFQGVLDAQALIEADGGC
jgi:hypothetical protein